MGPTLSSSTDNNRFATHVGGLSVDRDRQWRVSEFDEAMRLEQTGPDEAECGFGAGWAIGEAVNGGLVMALAATALRERIGHERAHPDPLAFSAYFLCATMPGPGSVHTQVARAGRSMTTGAVWVYQPGEQGPVERLRALATYGDLQRSHIADRTPPAPQLPAPGDCLPAREAPEHLQVPLQERLDLRFDPDCVGWAFGQPSRRGRLRGWLRLADGRDFDPISLLLALDALPPVAFDLGILGWAPTLELTAHVRARPAPGWVAIELASDTLAGGLLEEDARVWDSTGRLVAQSRQLASVRMPPSSRAPQGSGDGVAGQ